jgi:hypothetical protein
VTVSCVDGELFVCVKPSASPTSSQRAHQGSSKCSQRVTCATRPTPARPDVLVPNSMYRSTGRLLLAQPKIALYSVNTRPHHDVTHAIDEMHHRHLFVAMVISPWGHEDPLYSLLPGHESYLCCRKGRTVAHLSFLSASNSRRKDVLCS